MLIINQSVIDFVASFCLIVNSPSVVNLYIPNAVPGDFYCRYKVWLLFCFKNTMALYKGQLLDLLYAKLHV